MSPSGIQSMLLNWQPKESKCCVLPDPTMYFKNDKKNCVMLLLHFNSIQSRMLGIFSNIKFEILQLTSIKHPSSIKQPLSKVPKYLSVKCCIRYLFSTATSIKWLWPPFCCCKVSIYIIMFFLPAIKRPANYLFKGNGDR